MTKILVKFPTRERPHRFTQVLGKYLQLASKPEDIHVLITLDNDDPQGHIYKDIVRVMSENENIIAVFGTSTGKIDAVNRDMTLMEDKDWDILVLASDDMVCQVQGWDDIIRKDFMNNFKNDFDEQHPRPIPEGVIWYDDGFKTAINCMPVMSRKAYERFGYIYNPSYESLFCDNEFTEVWNILRKQIKKDQCLFLHEHYARHARYHHTRDALMIRNEKLYAADEKIYQRRKAEYFGLDRNKYPS